VTLRYLLDTNAVSEPLRPRPSKSLLSRIRKHEGEIAIASVVWHELQFGAARLPVGARREVVARYLADVVAVSFPILDYDRASAEWHALERARLVAAGRTPAFVDGQIAAVAHVNDLILVTANRSDFEMFKELRLQDWS
jgi:tRNA(fMet)-specific endonuclease VapC